MSDSEEDTVNVNDFEDIHAEIERRKKNPETSGMFVSGWDDEDEDIEEVKNPQDNPVTHVLWAAEHGKVDTLKEILTSSPGLVHARDSDGYSPLHRAAYGNHLEALSYLLSVGAKVNLTTEVGWTPLHSACNWNNYQIAARLLAAGADPAALSEGAQSPLHLAAGMSHCKSTLLVLLMREDISDLAARQNNAHETAEQLARGKSIYSSLFEMAIPAASYIRNLSFTCNPHYRLSIKQ
ncbi:ankyrin repeat domain-containing protein 49 [Plutella xylostella]|uniref:ankyrin repeat domain-containing protein 49 n=1 Tax=Plutella xylostella TaxID=51655 RepID=UPI0020324832|nr:ankyrin repeat domain-containing protein 49 [Plutella xylostella]